MPANTIYYSDKYYDDTFEYRCAPNTRAFCDAPSVGPRGELNVAAGGRAGT